MTVEFGEGARDPLRAELGLGEMRRLAPLIRRGVMAALRAGAAAEAEVTVTLLADDAIAELNQQYLSHAGPTDVLSFPLYEPGETAVGDVYIGVQRALQQAADLGVDAREELLRLAVHGTLHVLGHDHPEGAQRERSAMWALQERIVSEVFGT